ncbi:hypothetical protein [Sulfitobacter sp. M13]
MTKVAVLTTGRAGSMSLFHACQHVRNFTSGHDTREGSLASERVKIPDQHIEIDTRFAWMLGLLSEHNDEQIHYVFLTRSATDIAKSYNRRWIYRKGIMRAYCEGILQRDKPHDDFDIASDLVQNVEANIRIFLEGRPHSVIRLENWHNDLERFFKDIAADVNLDQARMAFASRHNPSRHSSILVHARYRTSRFVDAIENTIKSLRS